MISFKTILVLTVSFTPLVAETPAEEGLLDSYLNATELIQKYGYPAEIHEITTEDGYILKMFRIPHGKNGSGVNKKPILMLHGLFGQGENFISAGLNGGSLAYYCADNGYDVWLGNCRGTKHGMKHTTLDPDKSKFWQYSWHEMGVYDMPAMIDHVLQTNGQKKLYFVGHSQGGTAFYIVSSLKPEYSKKFALASLLAPAGYMKHFNNTLLLPLAHQHKLLTKIAQNSKLFELPPPWFNLTTFMYGACVGTPFETICSKFVSFFTSYGSTEFDPRLMAIMFKFYSTASTLQPLHYAQNVDSGRFRPWDYGKKKNMKLYGTPEPPDYPLERIDAPVAIYYSKGDTLAFWKDAEDMCEALPKCDRKFPMPNEKWSHIDYFVATDLVKKLNGPLVDYMENFD